MKANELATEPKLFLNPIEAVLGADLPIPLQTAVNDYIPDRGREQWGEDIAQGIRKAVRISERHLDELLDCEDVTRWTRAMEALADRPELDVRHVERILELASDDRIIVRRLSEKPGIPDDLSHRLRLLAERLYSDWRNDAFPEDDDRRTLGPTEVAEELGETPGGIRRKASILSETGGAALAYKNSSGWQITMAGLEKLRDWPDARKKGK